MRQIYTLISFLFVDNNYYLIYNIFKEKTYKIIKKLMISEVFLWN